MFAALYFPGFRLQAALRHEPESWSRPVALVEAGDANPRVLDVTPSARVAGVTEGLTAPQAQARCPEIRLIRRSVAREAASTEAIVQCAYGFSPFLEWTGPGWVTLDLRGLAELGKTPEETELRRWAGRLARCLADCRMRARMGVGMTPNVARLAARWGSFPIRYLEGGGGVGEGGEASEPGEWGLCVVREAVEFVARLPVAALEPATGVEEILRGWGVRTVGELLALGQEAVAERLGLEALGLFAAASVTAVRPLRLVQPGERFEEGHEFEEEVESLEPLLFILRRFVDSLGRRLEAVGWVAGTLVLRLTLATGERMEHRLQVPQPSRRAEILFRMLHTRLEGLRTASPIRAISLLAEPTRAEEKQFGLFEAALRDPHRFQETLARLVALVGSDRVGSPRREDGHRPDAFALVPPSFDPGTPSSPGPPSRPEAWRPVPWRRLRPGMPARIVWSGSPRSFESEDTTAAGARSGSGSGSGPGPRWPAGRAPESAARPLSLQGSIAAGKLIVALGPWRSSGHWWDERSWRREEWDVAMPDGQVLRVANDGEGWRIVAVLD